MEHVLEGIFDPVQISRVQLGGSNNETARLQQDRHDGRRIDWSALRLLCACTICSIFSLSDVVFLGLVSIIMKKCVRAQSERGYHRMVRRAVFMRLHGGQTVRTAVKSSYAP